MCCYIINIHYPNTAPSLFFLEVDKLVKSRLFVDNIVETNLFDNLANPTGRSEDE